MHEPAAHAAAKPWGVSRHLEDACDNLVENTGGMKNNLQLGRVKGLNSSESHSKYSQAWPSTPWIVGDHVSPWSCRNWRKELKAFWYRTAVVGRMTSDFKVPRSFRRFSRSSGQIPSTIWRLTIFVWGKRGWVDRRDWSWYVCNMKLPTNCDAAMWLLTARNL